MNEGIEQHFQIEVAEMDQGLAVDIVRYLMEDSMAYKITWESKDEGGYTVDVWGVDIEEDVQDAIKHAQEDNDEITLKQLQGMEVGARGFTLVKGVSADCIQVDAERITDEQAGQILQAMDHYQDDMEGQQ